MSTSTSPHQFHIPVMGIGHSIDTPLRVAPFGIHSVISLVDDHLLERLREYYSNLHKLEFKSIPRNESDGRAKRISAYLDMIQVLVRKKMEAIRHQPFFQKNEKQAYFDLLPNESPLKKDFLSLQQLPEGPEKEIQAKALSEKMVEGSIDVNIMVKLDRPFFDHHGNPGSEELSDAKAALRGYAQSKLSSSIVFSAGLNPKLFTYLSRFRDFYRDSCGEFKKKIILKVSDYRSALIQSKFLAKRGLEVSEYRVESGLNCGGHAFPSRGQLLPWILREFREKWHELTESVKPYVQAYYQKMGWTYVESPHEKAPDLTVQGGIGTAGEAQRLKHEFDVSRTGWGTPFLLVPEATNVDDTTRELLRQATEKDLTLSHISPLGIPFNIVKGTQSEIWTQNRIADGKPGSPCPKGFAVTSQEFSDRPICTASFEYQKKKLDSIEQMSVSAEEKEQLKKKVHEKYCICDHLGNGVLIKLGIEKEEQAPQIVCPGPNIAWFNRIYSLKEMVDHIYGRIPSLVPPERPHMFAKEICMNVDYFEEMVNSGAEGAEVLDEYRVNLENGINYCMELAKKPPFPDENLASLLPVIETQRARLSAILTPA